MHLLSVEHACVLSLLHLPSFSLLSSSLPLSFTHTCAYTPTCSMLECPPICHQLTHTSALDFIFMCVCERSLSHIHKHNRTHTAGLKGCDKDLREYYLRWSRLQQVGTRAHTHTHTDDAGLEGLTGRSDREYYLLWSRPWQLDMRKRTQAHTHGVSPLMRCVFFIRTQPLEAITWVILDFNGEIMDLEEGRERYRP